MAAELTREERAPERTTGRKSSLAVKLAQAAALAGMLVPLGSVPAESATITCIYGDGSPGGTGCVDSTPSSNTFTFFTVDYKYILEFFDSGGDPYSGENFGITITDVPIAPFFDPEFSPNGFNESLEGDYDCLLILGSQCVEFQIFQSSGPTSPWASYTMTIAWLAPTPTNGSPNTPRILERPSLDSGDPFVLDMCVAVPCQFFQSVFDPAISSGDTDFSTQIPVELLTPVPEPATLLLVGSGLGAILYRTRRKRLDSGSSRPS